MKVQCVWEHNGKDSLLYSDNFIGAFTRGSSRDAALAKMPDEIASYLRWRGMPVPESLVMEIVQEKVSRRFVWHDRIHRKAMYRMAVRTFGAGAVPNVFRFAM